MANPKKTKLLQDLIQSIRDRYFDMSAFTHDGTSDHEPATCDTASCMAGHLAAIRPELAAELATQKRFYDFTGLRHDKLARAIYESETGEKCPLDFYGDNTEVRLPDLSVEDTVAHILGENDEWPQLRVKDDGDYLDESDDGGD